MTEDRLTVRHIDLVDGNGVCRATLTSADDFDGTRVAPFAGLIIRDRTGRERGGIGTVDIADDSRVVTALDHRGGDAVGAMVSDDGSVWWGINDADEAGKPRSTRLAFEVAPDHEPRVSLLDRDERPRLRLTLSETGAGAIEFLDAAGEVVGRICPEDDGPAGGPLAT